MLVAHSINTHINIALPFFLQSPRFYSRLAFTVALLLQSPCLKKLRFRFCIHFRLRFLCSFRLNGLLNVRLNLLHQRQNGDERSAQCLRFQDDFQLVDLGAVDACVRGRRRWFVGLVRSSHPGGFGFAAIDFPLDCVQECERVFIALVLCLCLHGALHGAQLIICGRRGNFNGNLHLQHRIGGLMLVVVPGPPGVRGWTVSGTGLWLWLWLC